MGRYCELFILKKDSFIPLRLNHHTTCLMSVCVFSYSFNQLFPCPCTLHAYFTLRCEGEPISNPGGGICENFDRDARVIFLGLKFMKMSFFGFS